MVVHHVSPHYWLLVHHVNGVRRSGAHSGLHGSEFMVVHMLVGACALIKSTYLPKTGSSNSTCFNRSSDL